VLAKVKVTGVNPDAICYDATSQHVFTFNGRSSNATVLDAKSNNVVGTIPLDGRPEFAVADGAGKLYVNIEDKSELCEISTVPMTVAHVWTIAPGEEPSGLAIDAANHLLFSVCSNNLMTITDATSGKVVGTAKIGDRPDGVAFDPGTHSAYNSNGDGTITVVEVKSDHTFGVVESIPTAKGARTIAVDGGAHRLYLPTAEFGPTPSSTKENPRPRPSIVPGSFVVLEVGEGR
jgi:DNA-binding beta-propeller fold protein YncE